MHNKVLTRSKSNRVFGGVCGGLGEYFDLEPWIFRIIFLVLLFNGAGFLLYIILWIAIPEAGEKRTGEFSQQLKTGTKNLGNEVRELSSNQKNSYAIGLIVLLLGVFFLLRNFFPWTFNFEKLWPLVLIVLGFVILMRPDKKQTDSEKKEAK